MQNEMPCLFCVVDMHALTQDSGYAKAGDVRRATREVTAAYIAAGVDPKRTPLFAQSMVAEHAELAWIFNCVARLGWLDRMTQFKEKSGKHKERASVGLYTYPVLMAADILVYKATACAGRRGPEAASRARARHRAEVQHDFGVADFLPPAGAVIVGPATRVMSLRDGMKKMSKTDESDNSRINLTDSADTIAQKIRRAKTPIPIPCRKTRRASKAAPKRRIWSTSTPRSPTRRKRR